MIELMNFLMPTRLLQPLLKPIVRLFLGFVAIPIFRLFVRRDVERIFQYRNAIFVC